MTTLGAGAPPILGGACIFIPEIDEAERPDMVARVMILNGQAFATTWQVKVAISGDVNAATIRTRIETCLGDIDQQMSPYKFDSDLCRFNRAEAGLVSVPGRLSDVVRKAVEIAHLTDGAFDPCLLAAVEAWGFGSKTVDTGLPSSQLLNSLKPRAGGWRNLEFTETGIVQPGEVRLDLNAIAKGYAVDCLSDILCNEFAASAALVEIGGELKGYGVRPDGQPWWVEIEAAPAAASKKRPLIALCGWAVAVSGDWRRYFVHDGQAYAHTIDPQTGCPLNNRMVGAVVMDKDCWRADALATALMVMGEEKALSFVTDHNIAAILMVASKNGVDETLSPRMREYGQD